MLGSIVYYRLSPDDIERIRSIDEQYRSIGARIADLGHCAAGEVYPMIIVREFGNKPDSYVNGRVLLDGTMTLWVQHTHAGDAEGCFTWEAPEIDGEPEEEGPVPEEEEPVPEHRRRKPARRRK